MERLPGHWYAGCRTAGEILFESQYHEDDLVTAKRELINDFSLFMDDNVHWDLGTAAEITYSMKNYVGGKPGSWTIAEYTYYLVFYTADERVLAGHTERELAMLQTPGSW